MQVQIVSATRDYVFATWRNVVIAVWRVQTSVAALHELGKVVQSTVKALQAEVSLLQVVEPTCVQLTNEEFDALMTLLRTARQVRCSAVVYDGTGFRAAAVRAVVSAIAALQRTPFPHRIFSDTSSATEFQATQFGLPTSFARGLADAVAEVRGWQHPLNHPSILEAQVTTEGDPADELKPQQSAR